MRMSSEDCSSWCVCLSVSMLILALQATRWRISDTNGFGTTRTWKIKWLSAIFMKRLRSRDAVQAKKPICFIALGLSRPDPLALFTLEAQEVTTTGVYVLSTTVASPCQTLCEQLAWRPRVNSYTLPNPLISGTVHAQCAEGLHFSAF